MTGEIDRSARLPKLSGCLQPAPPRLSLTQRQIVQLMGFALLLAALAVGHVYVRFSIADIKVQHRDLQRQREELFRQAMELERQNAALCNLPELRRYARERLEMVESQPAAHATLSLSTALRDKYGRNRTARLDVAREPDEPKSAVEDLLLMLVDVNRAFAGEK